MKSGLELTTRHHSLAVESTAYGLFIGMHNATYLACFINKNESIADFSVACPSLFRPSFLMWYQSTDRLMEHDYFDKAASPQLCIPYGHTASLISVPVSEGVLGRRYSTSTIISDQLSSVNSKYCLPNHKEEIGSLLLYPVRENDII